jgi:hypothetical protein
MSDEKTVLPTPARDYDEDWAKRIERAKRAREETQGRRPATVPDPYAHDFALAAVR